jgi:spore germination cell wall hydrolase CwlJ-like protein
MILLVLGASHQLNDYKPALLEHISFSSLNKHDQREIECLALNLYREARGEPLEGILAVAFVTLNRVSDRTFPSSVCGVVYQRNERACQFSWTCMKSLNGVNRGVYEKLKHIAASVYINKHSIEDPSDGALFYHADYVDPYWNKVFNKTKEIGRHVFYKQ